MSEEVLKDETAVESGETFMKKLTLYTMALIIVALGATSCARREDYDKIEASVETFQEADIDDGPPCGCEAPGCEDQGQEDIEFKEYHNYYYPTLVVFYNTPRPLSKNKILKNNNLI